MIEQFINKKYSLRNLSDAEFDKLVPVLAEELESVDYAVYYQNDTLIKDWEKLKEFKSNESSINSTTRVGMKLLEHFNQNIWNVRGSKTPSFKDTWKKENLEKVIKWNRHSHSTPYMSEIRRGLYFCCGLSKVTMYRPTLAKIICDYFKPKIIFDPCAGWGGRMIGSVASGCHYIGIEPVRETFDNLVRMASFLRIGDKVTLINNSIENVAWDTKVQLILTSPPYFDLEIYDNSELQSINKYPSYDLWSERFLRGIIEKSVHILDGVSCWNVADYEKHKLVDAVHMYHKEFGMSNIKEFYVNSSRRPISGSSSRKDDVTYCFKYGDVV